MNEDEEMNEGGRRGNKEMNENKVGGENKEMNEGDIRVNKRGVDKEANKEMNEDAVKQERNEDEEILRRNETQMDWETKAALQKSEKELEIQPRDSSVDPSGRDFQNP